MDAELNLTQSQEDYLEAIYQIGRESGSVRASEISRVLNVKRPSVTGALRVLADKGLVHHSPYDEVLLTEEGESMARLIAARHGILKEFLVRVLGIDSEEAEANACRLEHALSGRVFSRLVQFLQFTDSCERISLDYSTRLGFRCVPEANGVTCDVCSATSRQAHGDSSEQGAEPMQLLLRDLRIGESAQIAGYSGGDQEYRHKLLSMGLTRGTTVTLVKVAPLGDPVEIEVRGFRLTVRKAEADILIMRRIPGPDGAEPAPGRRGLFALGRRKRRHRHGMGRMSDAPPGGDDGRE